MAIKGRLEKVGLSSLLELLALSGASGRVKVAQPAGEGLIVLRQGKVIFAASSSVRETLGHILICKGHLSEAGLSRALEIQHSSEDERRLGTILVAEGLVAQETLEDCVIRQNQKVLRELLGWTRGFYRFERFEIPELGEIEVRAREFLLKEGISADRVAIEAVADELERDERQPQPRRSLGSLMREFRTPSFSGEVTLPLLRFARGLTRRGAIFSASPRGFSGVGQYGLEADEARAAARIRSVVVGLGEPSVFREAIARREPKVLTPKDNAVNRRLLDELGGGWPREVLLAPLIVSGRVLMILYGDNLPGGEPIDSIEGLEEVLLHSALAMEKSLLDKRMEYAVELRREDS